MRRVLFLAAPGLALALLSLGMLFIRSQARAVISPPPTFLPQQVAAPNAWQIECADCPRQFAESTDRMLRLDSQGDPHLAYGRDHLYYTWSTGTQWHTEIADPAAFVGHAAALALDQAGNPHISYHDSLNGTLKYAYRSANGWQRIALFAATLSPTSIAVDSEGYAHISYSAAPDGDLHHAYQDAAGWHTELVDGSPGVCESSSLALDANDNPHISYCDNQSGDLRYAVWDGAAWQTTSVDTQVSASDTSLAIDDDGRPHISYADDWPIFDLKYATLDWTGWHTTTVDTQINVGLFNAIALDGSGAAHISYWADNTLRHASLEPGGWVTATVDAAGQTGVHTSIALDFSGSARIAYYDISSGIFGYSLKFARQSASGWLTEFVDTAASAGRGTSLQLDGTEFPHVSYVDETNADIKYAYQDITGWHVQTIDWEGRLSGPTDLALDSLGYAAITYTRLDPNGLGEYDLRYARQTGGGWQLETVDSIGSVGLYPSLALDRDGYAHISYYDETNKDLKYAYQDAFGWHLATPDAAGNVGQYTSLALTAEGVAHITYYASNRGLRHAILDASGWHTASIDTRPQAGKGSSLALDFSEFPRVAYYEAGSHALYYASWDGSGWISATVDTSNAGEHPTLALGTDGAPQISYTGNVCVSPGACGQLRHAASTAAGWITQTVDVGHQSTGFDSSLALTSGGEPRISYYDALTGDLMYATTPRILEGVAITGPATVTIGAASAFTATVAPLTAAQPVTYTWQASGQAIVQTVSGVTHAVSYTWDAPGAQWITLTATNSYGLVTATLPVTVADIAIRGLAAFNDGPTPLGAATMLSATLSAGSNVVFAWNFGDNVNASGTAVTHTYAAPGVYTATVTASNTAGSATATTNVEVLPIPQLPQLFLPVVLNED